MSGDSAETERPARPWDIAQMLRDADRVITIQAPMVRYSRLPFRKLCRKWGTDVAYTHMMLADSFVKAQAARDAEFATEAGEGPLVVQFSANDPVHIGQAAALVKGYCDAVDLNCGCPQRWALKEGIGGALMRQPEKVREMVRQVRQQCGDDLPCVIKIRLLDGDPRGTAEFARQMQMAGAAWITVHGRRVADRSTVPVDAEAVRVVREALEIPVVHNGDVTTLAEAQDFANRTGAQGAMSARGLLFNPALFAGHERTPPGCVSDFVRFSTEYGLAFQPFHHHLSCMLKDSIHREARKEFHRVTSFSGTLAFLWALGIIPAPRNVAMPHPTV